MKLSLTLLFTVIALLAPPALAQTQAPGIPFNRSTDLFVTDSTADVVWRLQDLNQDGDFNDAGEIITFYDDAQGSIPLTNNVGIAVAPDGRVFVCDSSEDIILVLLDVNGDGDANDAGEHEVWFDGSAGSVYGGNAAGIAMASAQDLTVDAQGVVWVASSNTTGGGTDAILRLEDLGGLPGANDAGEAGIYASFAVGATTGASIPTDVQIGQDGFVYYVENGTSGSPAKGVYRLRDDVVPNGNANDPGEVEPYFIPGVVTGASSAFHWGLAIDLTGAMYLNDTSGDVIWRAFDANGDGTIDAATEATIYYASASSLIWRMAVTSDGTLYAVESQSPDRVLRMRDDVVPNGNCNDPGEVVEVYDETLAAASIGNPRSCALAKAPSLQVNPMPPLGSNLDIVTDATVGDLTWVWLSTATIPGAALPPLGTLFLDPAATTSTLPFYLATVPAGGKHTFSVFLPNDPGLSGLTFYLQAAVGKGARTQLTNLASVSL